MKSNKKTVIIAVLLSVFMVVLIAISCMVAIYFSIDKYDNLSTKNGLVYDGIKYYDYDLRVSIDYHSTDCFAGETKYSVGPEPCGIKVGYIRNMAGFKVDAIMLDGSQKNVIYADSTVEELWLKEGYELPDIFDAKLGRIEIWKDNWTWSASEREVIHHSGNSFTLQDILDKQKFITADGEKWNLYKWEKLLFFPLSDISSLEITMGLSLIGGEPYLDYVTADRNIIHYAVKTEFADLFKAQLYI